MDSGTVPWRSVSHVRGPPTCLPWFPAARGSCLHTSVHPGTGPTLDDLENTHSDLLDGPTPSSPDPDPRPDPQSSQTSRVEGSNIWTYRSNSYLVRGSRGIGGPSWRRKVVGGKSSPEGPPDRDPDVSDEPHRPRDCTHSNKAPDTTGRRRGCRRRPPFPEPSSTSLG